ncbi:MAG: hypothetical protein Q9181_003007 [Wetmoreana brouardii]
MAHQRARDVEYNVHIKGIPKAVAQPEDGWKIVKDVVRNIIDGQPKKVVFNKDHPDDPVCFCAVQSLNDAKQAYEVLRGRNWYNFTGHGDHRTPSIMTVGVLVHQQKGHAGFFFLCGPSSEPVSPNASENLKTTRHRKNSSTVTHSRTSSSSSNTHIRLSPIATPYGIAAPTFESMNYPQVSMPITTQVPTYTVSSRAANPYVHAPAMWQPSAQNSVSQNQFEPRPPGHSQAVAAGPHPHGTGTARVPVRHCEIIIHNLGMDVSENMLRDLLARSGKVLECTIGKRGDKIRYAKARFAQAGQAEMAVKKLDKSRLSGREITVRLTKEGEKEGPIIVDGSVGSQTLQAPPLPLFRGTWSQTPIDWKVLSIVITLAAFIRKITGYEASQAEIPSTTWTIV